MLIILDINFPILLAFNYMIKKRIKLNDGFTIQKRSNKNQNGKYFISITVRFYLDNRNAVDFITSFQLAICFI